MFDVTLVTSSIGVDATIAAGEGPEPSGVRSSSGPPSRPTTVRSTVLPRVEMVGSTPRLVSQGKLRYEHTRHLGQGGVGEVLGARDNDIDRDVAVKRLRPEVSSPATIARFVEEVRTVGRLEHPNIVPIHDVGVDERGEYYFVMKYVDGETLESIIEKLAAGDPLYHAHYTFERRVRIVRALLEALAFAHRKGIVHRDIKPANVMIGAYRRSRLDGLGIAKQLRAAEDAVGDASASPFYPSGGGERGAVRDGRRPPRRHARVHVPGAGAGGAGGRALGPLLSLRRLLRASVPEAPACPKAHAGRDAPCHHERADAACRNRSEPTPAGVRDGPLLVSQEGTREGPGGALSVRDRNARATRAPRGRRHSGPVPRHAHVAPERPVESLRLSPPSRGHARNGGDAGRAGCERRPCRRTPRG